MTTTSQLPVDRWSQGIVIWHVILVEDVTVTLTALISAWPAFWSFTDAPGWKYFPLILEIRTVVPLPPVEG